MKRRRSLRTDPEKQRRWEERTRERALDRERKQRSGTVRTSGTNEREDWRSNNPAFRRNSLPGLRGFTERVFTLYGRRCVVCKRSARQAHHAVPLRTIFARGQDKAEVLGCDARNGVPICMDCHEQHEKAMRRIRRRELPRGVIRWAYDNDFGWLIDDARVYPT